MLTKNTFFQKKFIILLFLICIQKFSFAQQASDGSVEKFNEFYNLLLEHYADTINTEKLLDYAIQDILSRLDPHSLYINKENAKKASNPINGISYEGIGCGFSLLNDTLVVTSINKGGGAQKQGMQVGDRIISINGVQYAGRRILTDEYIKLIRGSKGTMVKIGLYTKTGENKTVVVTRDVVPEYGVETAYKIDEENGYIRIEKFTASTAKEFKEALIKLKAEGVKNLIIDLTFNDGGYVKQGIAVADEFLGEGKLIAQLKGNHIQSSSHMSTGKGAYKKGKIIILIDEETKSTAEILAGALQDWDRALLVGRRTYGKDLVLFPYHLSDGSLVRLTVGHYFLPSGRPIQKPYKIQSKEDYIAEIEERKQNGELTSEVNIKIDKSKVYKTANGREVYGGGGIIPDVFVSTDTLKTDYFNQAESRGLLGRFSTKYIAENISTITQYTTLEQFIREFKVSEFTMKDMTDYYTKEGLPYNQKEYRKSYKIFSTNLKAYIGNSLFGNDAFFKISNEGEPIYLKAIELIKKENFTKYGVQKD